MKKLQLQNWTKEQLVDEVARLRKRKKYGLVWEDKPEDVVEQCKTELPVLKEVKNKAIAKDKNGPVNILIEGDNYHALSVLNYTHKGKIDVIYIDPPYNTGNKDFKYNDAYVDQEDTYRHSKWLSFMKKRLVLAKNLLKKTGVIFISIDDNEMAQLKMLMDSPDLFGSSNFVAIIIWEKTDTNRKGSKYIKISHEYVVCYIKNLRENNGNWKINKILSETISFSNPDNDKRGPWFSGNICSDNYREGSKNCFVIKSPTGISWKRKWFRSQKEIEELIKDKRIYFGKNCSNVPRLKIFKNEWEQSQTFVTGIWKDVGSFGEAKESLANILGSETIFETPKTVSLVKKIVNICSGKEALVLDFMAGSGTTGQAVLELNKDDGGNRRFILCTNNENNIATDICYPRIARVIDGYKDIKGKKIAGIKSNLKYFRTAFVGAEPNDKNKETLTKQATEMLCMREDTFEPVKETGTVKIFKNSKQHTGIVFDEDAIPVFKKEIAKIGGAWSVYIFSLGDDTFEDEFEDMRQKITVAPIPEAILRVYRRLFKP